ncbi:MAG: tetratricopeptide repeat protein [Opitutaceae bacterium]|nr:tetratricopeptide repeat protein [Opitutaceae bacterium]
MAVVPRVFPPLIIPLLLLVTLARADETPDAVWRLLAANLPGEAGVALKSTPPTEPRARALAEAVVLTARQPLTDERLLEAERRFEALAEVPDEVGAAALYLTGRLHQLHFSTPDYTEAARYYRRLAERQPASPWAQLGLVKLALLTLHVLPGPATPADRIAAAEVLLPRVTVPPLRRDLLIVLGRARLFHEVGMEQARFDLLAADAIGGLTGLAEADVLLQIGELSFRAGDDGRAEEYFRRFLKGNDADPRVYTVEQRLKVIAARKGGR